MISVENAESALKNTVLGVVSNQINTAAHPVLAKTKTKNIDGKEIRASIRLGDASNVSVVSETSDLPTDSNTTFAELIVPVKNLYASFTITDKALRTSGSSTEEFASLLNSEMENVINASKNALNKMLYKNGKTIVTTGTVDATNKDTINVVSASQIAVGDDIIIADAGNVENGVFKVTAKDGTELTLATAVTLANNEKVSIYKVEDYNALLNVNGVDSIFGGKDIYNIEIAQNAGIEPFAKKVANSTAITEEGLMNILAEYEEMCGSSADIYLTNTGLRNKLIADLRNYRANIDFNTIEGGFVALNFNGVPLHADTECLKNNIYFINSNSFAMYQTCDWSWMQSDEGDVLSKVPAKAVYNATLVKYCDFVCTKPFVNGKAYNFAE